MAHSPTSFNATAVIPSCGSDGGLCHGHGSDGGLPHEKDLLVDVTWSRSQNGPALSDAGASRHRAGGAATAAAPRHLHRRKGGGTFTAGSSVVGVFWDYAGGAGPEPIAVVADAEFVLLFGNMSRGYVERLHGGIPVAESQMARRLERFVGAPVDMTWDLHGWLFHALDPSASSSSAVFTFHARGASETGLWMDDDGADSSGSAC